MSETSMELLSQRWLTRAEAAGYLKLCEAHLDKLIKEGRLPVARLGRRILIDRLEIDRRLMAGGV